MKHIPILIASLVIPASVAFAQTPTTGTTSSIPYIPLIGSSGGSTTTGASSASAWFIDVAAKLVVFCSQTGATGGTAGTQSFTCTAQPIPTSATGATPSSGAGAPPSGAAGAAPTQ